MGYSLAYLWFNIFTVLLLNFLSAVTNNLCDKFQLPTTIYMKTSVGHLIGSRQLKNFQIWLHSSSIYHHYYHNTEFQPFFEYFTPNAHYLYDPHRSETFLIEAIFELGSWIDDDEDKYEPPKWDHKVNHKKNIFKNIHKLFEPFFV